MGKIDKHGGNNSKKDQDIDHHGKVIVNGVEYQIYPTPDVSTYTYDEGSGYYYDSVTQYYYDAKSQYYYDSNTKQYVYWCPEHRTYLPAPEESGKTGAESGDKKTKEDKKDKVKTAKRIAKDMEKWAKTLNQKKEKRDTYSVPQQPPDVQIQKQNTEDLAFNMVLTKKEELSGSGLASLTGYGSADEPEEEVASMNSVDEQQFTDWSQLACLLCKRAFPSKEKLIKHNQVSDLHKSNMEAWHREHRPQSGAAAASAMALNFAGGRYRDRAQERRQKYGIDDEGPRPNRLKEKYLQAVEDAEFSSNNSSSSSSNRGGSGGGGSSHNNKGREKAIDESNIGSKMLQKMGWKEGLGLGKANQGRTSIIEAEARSSQAGLGSKNSVKSNPNESYKDSVKRTLFSRYHDMD